MLQCGWTEKALCYTKAARHRRLPIVWFCSHTISRIGKLIQKECRLILSRDREKGMESTALWVQSFLWGWWKCVGTRQGWQLVQYCDCTVAAAAAKSLQYVWLCATHRRQPTRLPRPWDSPGKNTGVGCHFLLQCMKVKREIEVAQSCPTLRDPMECSLPGSSIHGSFQARVLEWGAIAFSNVDLVLPKFSPN